MKNSHIIFLIGIIAGVMLSSCRPASDTTTYKVRDGYKPFKIDVLRNTNTLLLTKTKASLKNGDDIVYEMPYTIEVPKKLKKISTVVTTIPNVITLSFRGNQKIFIYPDKSNAAVTKLHLSKDEFEKEIAAFDVSGFGEIKSARFNGIVTHEQYLLIYINVKYNQLPLFDKAIQSQNIESD